GLTLEQVAGLVRRSSQDRPGGSVKTPEGEILLRGKSQRYRGPDFEDIIVATRVDGTTRRLSEVAAVRDTFRDIDTSTLFDGKPAAILKVFRVGEQDAINVAETVKAYIERKRPELPAGIELGTWFDRSNFLQDRIDLLQRNALIGLVLVFLCLMLFLDLRLAFWTTLGIPISFMGAFWLLPLFGVSINMISLFAFIVVLGIVVDDAIVVGENIFEYRHRGLSRAEAAVCGVREMAVPVTFAILTTVVAFMPLMFTAGEIGKIVFVIPIVVVTVLLISLVEALLILPAHLTGQRLAGSPGPIARMQAGVQAALDRFVRGHYARMLTRAVRYRYVTVSVALAMLLVTLGLIVGGHIRWVFFEDMDADNVVVGLVMPQGTPVSETTRIVARLEASMEKVKGELEKIHGPIFKHTSTTIGDQPFAALVHGQEMRGRAGILEGSGHLAEVNVELVSGEDRDISAKKIARIWREATGDIAGVSSLTFRAIFFSPGEAVNVELAHQDFEKLLEASDKVQEALVRYGGVSDVADSFEPGKREVKIVLTEAGRTLGLTQDDLDRQVRGAFYGAEAERIQRGRDDMKVMVRFPESERRSMEDLERMRIALPDGNRAAFAAVARVAFGRGYAQIDRVDRRRVVSVTADVDETQITSNEVNRNLREKVLPRVAQAMPGLTYSFEGEQKEQRESLFSLFKNFLIAMFMIYGLLGVQFKSYAQPLIVMSAIPFGLIGAVVGHVVFGMDLSFLSGFGVVALTGVVVNDSLIMIDLINRMKNENLPLEQVLVESGVRRFRPIMLTTLTTFCGLTPMLLEQSLQARFLVPMAVSLAFGVVFATMITLLLVPTLYRILEDAHGMWRGTAVVERAGAASAGGMGIEVVVDEDPIAALEALAAMGSADGPVGAGQRKSRVRARSGPK
ncbi:MAG: efflux RND transporter permease subunit, partial [Phycisphaerae bacterium]|nr:efflux RND transporter permease subunit [Phycisphaerae bacterium]